MRRICQLFIVEPPTPFRDTEGLALDLYGSCVVAERRGTPVLAYRAGAVEEVIDQGVTGMIVDNIDQARIGSVQVAALDRRKVRRRFEERPAPDWDEPPRVCRRHCCLSHAASFCPLIIA
jgi:hypothetical protein